MIRIYLSAQRIKLARTYALYRRRYTARRRLPYCGLLLFVAVLAAAKSTAYCGLLRLVTACYGLLWLEELVHCPEKTDLLLLIITYCSLLQLIVAYFG